jgi:hypothetical protein
MADTQSDYILVTNKELERSRYMKRADYEGNKAHLHHQGWKEVPAKKAGTAVPGGAETKK